MSSFSFRPFNNTSPKASDAAKASAENTADPIVDTSGGGGGGVDDDLVLAVVVPEGASEGSTFHVTLADRVFEVTTPAGVSPGTTINLIVRAEAGDKPFESLKEVCGGVLQAAQTISDTYGLAERAHQVDEKYKVTERAAAVGGSVLAKAQNLNEKYDLARRLNSILASLDASFQVQKRAVCAEQYIVAFAREIDAKFAISATSASIVVKGANAIVTAYRKALLLDERYRVTQTASAVAGAAMKRVGLGQSSSEGAAPGQENAPPENAADK